MANKKGAKKKGGRTKGTPNKVTKELKEMILTALEESGGVEYLKRTATLNSSAFLSLLGKVLPTTLANDTKNPLLFPKLEIVLKSE